MKLYRSGQSTQKTEGDRGWRLPSEVWHDDIQSDLRSLTVVDWKTSLVRNE
jgi:hypothetical protein